MTSLLTVVDPKKAEGKVAELYGTIEKAFGSIPNAMKLHSISPELLERQFSYIGYFMEHSGRSDQFFTLLRLLVSAEKDCEYCVTLNTGMLLNAGMSMDEVAAIRKEPSTVPMDEAETTLLLYVLKVTHAPKSGTAEDIKALRGLGLSDKDIFEAVHYGANMVMVDILFDSFQLEND